MSEQNKNERISEAVARLQVERVNAERNSEAYEPVNDASRTLVQAFVEVHGAAWLGKVNAHKPGDEKLRQHSGVLYNFGADFVVPAYDEELERLVAERNGRSAPYSHERNRSTLDAIIKRVEALGGEPLAWS